jgi:hypothetical protein
MRVLNTTYYEGLDKVVEAFFTHVQQQWPERGVLMGRPAPVLPDVLMIDYASNPAPGSVHKSFVLLRDVDHNPPRIGLMRLSVVRQQYLFASSMQQLAVAGNDGILPQEVIRGIADGILQAPSFSLVRSLGYRLDNGSTFVVNQETMRFLHFPEVEVRLLPRALSGVGRRKKLLDAIWSERRLRVRAANLETTIADIEADLTTKKQRLVKTRADLKGTRKVLAQLKQELNFHIDTQEG